MDAKSTSRFDAAAPFVGPACLALTSLLAFVRGDVLVGSLAALLVPSWFMVSLRLRSSSALIDRCMDAVSRSAANAKSSLEFARWCHASLIALGRMAEHRREVDVTNVVAEANRILECTGAKVRMHATFPSREIN